MVTRSLSGMSAEDCAARMDELGFYTTELCFTFSELNCFAYNGNSDLSKLTDEEALRICSVFRKRGIELVSLGVFSNLIEPDAGKLEENFAFFRRHIEIAELCGIKYISTENGFVPGRRGVNADTYEKDFEYFVRNMKRLCQMAAEHGISVAFEPCQLDLTPSAKRTLDFINICSEPNLKILLDPANLIANSSEEDMFRYLSGHVAYFHGKDRKVTDAYGRLLGDGDIDWVKFFACYHKYCEDVPFILEYVNNSNCAETKQRAIELDARSV